MCFFIFFIFYFFFIYLFISALIFTNCKYYYQVHQINRSLMFVCDKCVDSGCVNGSTIKQVSLLKRSKSHKSCCNRVTQCTVYCRTQLLGNSCLTEIAKQQTGTNTDVQALQELPAGTFRSTGCKYSGFGSVLTSLPCFRIQCGGASSV